MRIAVLGRSAASALIAALACGTVQAQSQGWYIGAGAGQSKANNPASCSDLSGVFDPVNFSCTSNDTSTGWKLFAGYQFNPKFALEGTYVDLGNFKISASGSVIGLPATASGSDKASGLSFDAVGALPIGEQFGLIGRIGVFAWMLDSSANVSVPGAAPGNSTSTSDKPSGVSLDVGVGAKYDFTQNVGVRAEWQRFASIGNSDTGKSDIDLISASLVYRFK